MNTNQFTELSHLTFNVGKMALKSEQKITMNSQVFLLNENILETILEVNKHLSVAQVSSQNEIPKEITVFNQKHAFNTETVSASNFKLVFLGIKNKILKYSESQS